MPDLPRKIPVVFYRTPAGREVVRDWLKQLARADRDVIGQDLMRAQFRWPIGMPLCRPMGRGIWEVRSELAANRIARLLFCVADGRIVILHGYIKKTQRTPVHDMAVAIERKRIIDGQET
jgi:phage-related protein